MNELNNVYEWDEVLEKKIDVCYCKCCACKKPILKKSLTWLQKTQKFFFCTKCANYIKKESVKNICSRYGVSNDVAGDYKLSLQKRKQDSKLSDDQKINVRIANFQSDTPKSKRWTVLGFYQKFCTDPKCYLTGTPINLEEIESWSLDHIIPKSRGGSSKLSNCGLVTKQINLSKHTMTPEEFIELCKTVVDFNKNDGKMEK